MKKPPQYLMYLYALLIFGAPFAGSDLSWSSTLDCPKLEEGETQADCPWAEVSRQASLKISQGQTFENAIAQLSPLLLDELTWDQMSPELLSLWGRSLNFDEFAHSEIIDMPLIDGLLGFLNAPARDGRVVHAGIEHTYGYLLSLIHTPYGFKRARWVEHDLDQGFGLPTNALSPTPSSGTLLRNVTYFFGRIALGKTMLKPAYQASVLPEILEYPYENLRTQRIEEKVIVQDQQITLFTDLVEFPNPPAALSAATANRYLLIYSVRTQSSAERVQAKPVLITGFPVNEGFVQSLLDPSRFGESQSITTRYNAYVQGLTGQTPTLGTRHLFSTLVSTPVSSLSPGF